MASRKAASPTGGAVSRANGSRTIDLDEARKARAEAAGDPVTVRFGGKEFELPPELPLEFAFLADEGRERESIHALFGDDADRWFSLGPSLDDLKALLAQVASIYGLGTGE